MASKERRVEANGKLATEGEGKREKKEGNKLLIRPLSQPAEWKVVATIPPPFSTLHLEQRQHYQDDHQGKAEENIAMVCYQKLGLMESLLS